MEDERTRLLDVVDKIRTLLADWTPLTPQDWAEAESLFGRDLIGDDED